MTNLADRLASAKFKYGKSWDRYPVMPGQVYRVGLHRLACLDLEILGAVERQLEQWPRPTLCYTDPPWGQALAQGFRTNSELGGPADFRRVLHRVMRLALIYTNGPLAIEMGH